MSNPAAPKVPDEPETPGGPPPLPEGPNPFGPDAPNVREDEVSGSLDEIEADPPEPAATPLSEADFAPDQG